MLLQGLKGRFNLGRVMTVVVHNTKMAVLEQDVLSASYTLKRSNRRGNLLSIKSELVQKGYHSAGIGDILFPEQLSGELPQTLPCVPDVEFRSARDVELGGERSLEGLDPRSAGANECAIDIKKNQADHTEN